MWPLGANGLNSPVKDMLDLQIYAFIADFVFEMCLIIIATINKFDQHWKLFPMS